MFLEYEVESSPSREFDTIGFSNFDFSKTDIIPFCVLKIESMKLEYQRTTPIIESRFWVFIFFIFFFIAVCSNRNLDFNYLRFTLYNFFK